MAIISLFLSLCTAGCASGEKEQDVELYVSAAASMTDALTEIGEKYREEHPGVEPIFNFESSGTLKTQIEQGAPADVFIPASMRQMEELEDSGFIEKDSRIKLLENKVVLIKPAESALDIHAFEDVVKTEVSMIAIGNADVPAGQYAEQIYRRLGLWEQVKEKANLASNVRQVLDWTATKNVDCGVVYATDAKAEAGVTVVCEAPEGLSDSVIYPAGIIKGCAHAEEAGAFLEYLKTDEVKEIFEKYGFTIYEE